MSEFQMKPMLSESVNLVLREIAEGIGPGVTGLSFTIDFGPEQAKLTPEDASLQVEKGGDGVIRFIGTRDTVRVTWTFTPQLGGYDVRLSAEADDSVQCVAMDSLVLDFAPAGILDWRMLHCGPDDGLWKVSDFLQAEHGEPAVWANESINGVFPNSREPGLLIGIIIPGHSFYRIKPVKGEQSLRYVCFTRFKEGQSRQQKVVSEGTFICGKCSIADSIQRYASRIPEQAVKTTPPVGWSDWDYYFGNCHLADVIENMEFIRQNPVLAPRVKFIQVDHGWARADGDWYANDRFDGEIEKVAAEIINRGFIPGIHLAFLRMNTAAPGAQQTEMLAKDRDGNPMLFGDQSYYMVDPTHPAGEAFLGGVISRLHQAGFRLFKLDFVYEIFDAPGYHNPDMGDFAAMSHMNRIVKQAAGPDSHILSCGTPVQCGPELVESGRIGIDIHNRWSHVTWAFEYLMTNFWVHNRIWNNDIDYLVVRGPETSTEEPKAPGETGWRWHRGPDMSYEEAKTWTSVVMMSGGSMMFGDRLSVLNEQGLELLHQAGIPTGISAEPLDLCDGPRASLWLQNLGDESRLTVINWSDEPVTRTIDFAALGFAIPEQATEYWSASKVVIKEGKATLDLPAHGAAILVF